MKTPIYLPTALGAALIVLAVLCASSLGNYVHSGAKCTPASGGSVPCTQPSCLVFRDQSGNCDAVRCGDQTTNITFDTCQQSNNQTDTCSQSGSQTVNCGNGQGVQWPAGQGGCGFATKQQACATGTTQISCGSIPNCSG